jgi:hypothetical protein
MAIIAANSVTTLKVGSFNVKNVEYDVREDADTGQLAIVARCAFFDGNLHSRLPSDPTPLLRLKLFHACDQWYSRVSTPLTGWLYKLRPNTKGQAYWIRQLAAAHFKPVERRQ